MAEINFHILVIVVYYLSGSRHNVSYDSQKGHDGIISVEQTAGRIVFCFRSHILSDLLNWIERSRFWANESQTFGVLFAFNFGNFKRIISKESHFQKVNWIFLVCGQITAAKDVHYDGNSLHLHHFTLDTKERAKIREEEKQRHIECDDFSQPTNCNEYFNSYTEWLKTNIEPWTPYSISMVYSVDSETEQFIITTKHKRINGK